jgi:glycosyltransferase involved in cell wall biosynthesis
MKGLKILWFNWRCWLNPAMGGAEIFTREISTRLVKEGNEVTLFTAAFSGSKQEELLDGVKIVRSGSRFSVYSQAKKFYAKHFGNEGFDVVIDEINTIPFFAPRFVKNGEKVFALIHQLAREYWFYEVPFPISHLGYHFLEDRWLRQYVGIPTITVSESTRSDLNALGFRHVFIVPEGLDFRPLDYLPEKNCKPTIIFSGRLKHAKRPDHAIKAFEVVKKKIPEAELWVLGDGPFRSELQHLADDSVKFFGSLDSFERRELVKKSWVLVNPGIREGWGLNIVEANALGVPCVAYSVPGLKDSVQDGSTGLLVKSGDIQALAETLLNVLNNSVLRRELSENALNYSRVFSWDKSADNFMRKIEENVGDL